jgi:hypothetical protein
MTYCIPEPFQLSRLRIHENNYAGVSRTNVPFLLASVRPSNSVNGAESQASIDLNSCIKRTITYELSVSANCSVRLNL